LKIVPYLSWISGLTIFSLGFLFFLIMNQLVLQQQLVYQSVNATRLIQLVQQAVIDFTYGVPMETEFVDQFRDLMDVHKTTSPLPILWGRDLMRRWETKNQQLHHVIDRLIRDWEASDTGEFMDIYTRARPAIKENMGDLEKLYTEAMNQNQFILLGGLVFAFGLVIVFQILVFRPLRLDARHVLRKRFHKLFFSDLSQLSKRKRSRFEE